MFPKDGNYICRKCGNLIPIKNNAKNFVSKAKIDDREVVVLEGEQISGLPTTSAKCPECGNNTAAWWLRQLRSADESETRFLKCTKCGFTWREYDWDQLFFNTTLKKTFLGKWILMSKASSQVRALSCLRQSLKSSGFLTKIYIVTGSLSLMIFQFQIAVCPDSESFLLK